MTTELRTATLIAWALAATVLTLVGLPAIAHLWFPDTDDAMRLVEVRDWLDGQSWWDVSQHRLWDGAFRMHWSRIVDLPLALVMAAFRPIVGALYAERIAMVTVPLATLFVVMTLAARLTAMLGGEERAKLALLLTALAPPILYQIRPMRIDHHGWQVALALGAVVALLGPPTRRTGAAAGVCLGTLIVISLEGLPITAVIMGVALLAWASDPGRRAQPLAMTGALLVTTVALHIVTRGPAMLAPACDAIAPVWIVALAITCAGVGMTVLASPRTLAMRVAGLMVSALAGAAAVRFWAPVCTRGPFATLDPLVYRLWYSSIAEGLPAWRQDYDWMVMAYAMPLVGLAGGIRAWQASEGDARRRWTMMLALAAPAFVISVLVIRAAATANALALPGAAWLLLAWLTRARAIHRVLPRIAATAGAFLGAAPGIAGVVVTHLAPHQQPAARVAGSARAGLCTEGHEIADLARLPKGRVFAPVDVTPQMLATTGHSGVSAGYHRNAVAIHRVLATFLASPDRARASVLATHADYVAGCPGENETEIYKLLAPDGFWARLERGERFAWLQPVAIPGSSVLAWRVEKPEP